VIKGGDATVKTRRNRMIFFIASLFVLPLLIGSVGGLYIPAHVEAKELTYTIATDNDDAGPDYYGDNLWITSTASTYLRFPLKVPKNATITSALLYVKSKVEYDTETITITRLNSDNCPSFTTTPPAGTGTPISWTNQAWTPDSWYSVDIGAIVTTYIGLAGYVYGSYLGVSLAGSAANGKAVYSYATGAANASYLVVTYTGGDSVFDVLMADPHVRTKQKIFVGLSNIDAGDTLYVALDDTPITGFNGLAITDGTQVVPTPDYTGLTAGSHHVDIYVKDSGDATRTGTFTKTWTTTHSGYPKVGINENNSLCIRDVGGTSCTLFFPLTAYIHLDEQFAGSGHIINPVINGLTYEGYASSHTIQSWKGYLDSANARIDTDTGRPWMFVGPGRGEWTDTVDYAKKMSNAANCSTPSTAADCSYINYTKTHASLLGWMWGDEYDLWGIPGSTPVADKEASHQYDTDHPVFINLYGYEYARTEPAGTIQPQYLYLYNGSTFSNERKLVADVIGSDYYPEEFFGTSPAGVAVTLANYLKGVDQLQAWNYNLAPFIPFHEPQDEQDPCATGPLVNTLPRTGACGNWACINGRLNDSRDWTADPTAPQIKNNLWLSIIHGSKGIFYFSPDLFCKVMQYQVDELRTFKLAVDIWTPMILAGNSTKATYQTLVSGEYTIPLNWSAATSVGSGGRVDYTVREYDGKTYVIAARVYQTTETPGWPDSANATAVSATFTLTGLTGAYQGARKLGSGSVEITDGVFVDTFTQYGVEIYEIISGEAGGDVTAPAVTVFTVPASNVGYNIPITMTCTDAVGVTGYCVTEVNDSATCYDGSPTWSATPITSYPTGTQGTNKPLYAFCKDLAGNISASATDSVTVTSGRGATFTVR
jgi:hypothetical protein